MEIEKDIIEFKMRINISHYLDTELLTCQGVIRAIDDLERNLHFYLDVALYDVWDSLNIAHDVADLKNGMCLNETSDKIDASIEKGEKMNISKQNTGICNCHWLTTLLLTA